MIRNKKLLEKFNIYIQHINYPTVPKGEEMLRITTTPLHDEKMINELVEAISYFKTQITSNKIMQTYLCNAISAQIPEIVNTE